MEYKNTVGQRRRSIVAFGFAAAVAVYILSAGGCDFASDENIVKEANEPHYRRGMEELRRGNHQEAFSAFSKVVEKRKDAPESHLELGRLYLSDMKDPISAIYHFRKFLELCPNSSASMQVRQLIDTAKKRFAASLPESPFENNMRRMELEEMLDKVQKENLELKQKLADAADKLDALSRVSVAAPRIAPQASSSSAAGAKPQQPAAQHSQQAQAKKGVSVARDIPPSYVVQPGDSLTSISRRFYGTSNRWKDILKANRDRLVSPESLRAGQTLRLPR